MASIVRVNTSYPSGRRRTRKRINNIFEFFGQCKWAFFLLLAAGIYALYKNGSFEFFGIFKASSRPNETKTIVADMAKPAHPTIKNNQNIAPGRKGTQYNAPLTFEKKYYSNKDYTPMTPALKAKIKSNLINLFYRYPNPKTISLQNNTNDKNLPSIINDLTSLLTSAGFSVQDDSDPRSSISGVGYPVLIVLSPEDSTFTKDLLIAIDPYIHLNFGGNYLNYGRPFVKFQIFGSPSFDGNGTVKF